MRLVVKDGFRTCLISHHRRSRNDYPYRYCTVYFRFRPHTGFCNHAGHRSVALLFSSIFIARLLFEWMLDKNMTITTGYKWSQNAFQNIKINFIGLRYKMYILSIAIIIPGIISIFVRGLDPGLDFTGGRSYMSASMNLLKLLISANPLERSSRNILK